MIEQSELTAVPADQAVADVCAPALAQLAPAELAPAEPPAPAAPAAEPTAAAAPATAALARSDLDAGPPGRILVVDDDELVVELLDVALSAAGHTVVTATTGADALEKLPGAAPDLILSDINMPDMDGFGLVKAIRSDPSTRWIPLIFLTSRGDTGDVVTGLDLGADDYLVKPFAIPEVLARVRGKLDRPPVPTETLPMDRRTGLVSEERFEQEVSRELARAALGGASGTVAVIALHELPSVTLRLGATAVQQVLRDVVDLFRVVGRPLDVAGRASGDRVALLLPEADPVESRRRLQALASVIASHQFVLGAERLRLTPSIGFASFADLRPLEDEPDPAGGAGVAPTADTAPSARLLERAGTALEYAAAHLDLMPLRWQPTMEAFVAARRSAAAAAKRARPGRARLEPLRVPLQIAATFLIGVVGPFFLYLFADRAGFDITPFVYLVVVVALAVTGALIWIEGLLALDRPEPPEEPGAPEPPASAIIAAFLPNEAATVIETIEAFLRIEYDAPLQVILAYNTPQPMPIEAVLADMARREPRFTAFKVEGSTSKAQNVNAALAIASGEFVGVFDADHHPDPGNYRRAWRWLSNGYDVVQGHCLVRNGDASWVARLCAVEFEAIYTVTHPGRARMHDFGIFGGSNGYWRTGLLHEIRMRGSMLTEDIDSSLRVVEGGGRIASDPGLVSRELATTTLHQLWNQRMRWAQGWFQVSMKHLRRGLCSTELSPRQKLGLVHLLLWRELYPWISVQMFPLIGYWIYRGERLDWLVPIFVLTTLFTLSVGPFQTYFAYRLSDPEIRQHKRWYLSYLLLTSVFYTEYKNIIARVAQVKEAMGERAWKVTPRSNPPAPPTDD